MVWSASRVLEDPIATTLLVRLGTAVNLFGMPTDFLALAKPYEVSLTAHEYCFDAELLNGRMAFVGSNSEKRPVCFPTFLDGLLTRVLY